MFYVYAYLRLDFSPYYIGKGSGMRAFSKCKGEIKPPKDKSRIIILRNNLNEDDAFKYEVMLIKLFGRKDIGTGILRNKSDGGTGSSGWKPTEEQRLNHYMKRPEWRAIQSQRASGEKNPRYGKGLFGKDNPMFGKHRTDEWKESMRGCNNPLNKPEYRLTCEVCNKTMPKNVFRIWGHGPNCGKDNGKKAAASIRTGGINNPMYGRTPHNKLTNITTPLGKFNSIKDAARVHKVSEGTILYRIKSPSDKFKEYLSDN